MKNSWFISVVFLLAAGCVSIKPLHVSRCKLPVAGSTPLVPGSGLLGVRYAAPVASNLYKATLDIKKHHLTGLLVIKRMATIPPAPSQTVGGDSSGIYRIVFMNEIGMTFFDLEMKTDSFKVVSCFGPLNKKALMRIFETDFSMLTRTGPMKNEKMYRQAGTNNLVVSAGAGKYKIWQTYSPSGDTLFTTAAKSTIADPVIITYNKYKDGLPLKITIENPFIGMKLILRKLVQ